MFEKFRFDFHSSKMAHGWKLASAELRKEDTDIGLVNALLTSASESGHVAASINSNSKITKHQRHSANKLLAGIDKMRAQMKAAPGLYLIK